MFVINVILNVKNVSLVLIIALNAKMKIILKKLL
jgi:hypothetical protein